MKKYTSGLFVLAIVFGLFNINFVQVKRSRAAGVVVIPVMNPTDGANGKIKFIKKLLQAKTRADAPIKGVPSEIQDLVAMKNYFLINAGGANKNLGLWAAKEDGSAIFSRDISKEATDGQGSSTGFFTVKLAPDWSSDGSFFAQTLIGEGEDLGKICLRSGEIYSDGTTGCAEIAYPHGVTYYQIDGSSIQKVSGVYANLNDKEFYPGVSMLTNKVVAIPPRGGTGLVYGLPDMNKLGSVASAPESSVGFGNFIIDVTNGKVYKVSNSSKVYVKTLPDIYKYGVEPYIGPVSIFNSASWPPKIAFITGSTGKLGLAEYKLSGADMVLDKTYKLPDSTGGSWLIAKHALWGKYLAVVNGPSTVDIWNLDTNTKVDSIILAFSPAHRDYSVKGVAISQGGYLAVTTGDNAVYLYKLNLTNSGTTTSTVDNGCAPGNLFDTVTGLPCNSSCTTISSQTLKLGSRGEDVKTLQRQLNVDGANLVVDGSFGPETKQALIAYQQKNSLVADGIAGKKTAATMNCQGPIKTYGTKPTTPTTPLPTTNKPPIISGTITGPTSLNVNQEGTWTITATDPNNDDLAWSVDWGEGRSIQTCNIKTSSNKQDWSYDISHSWSDTGSHTFTVYVGDCRGGTASKTFSVTVNESSGGVDIIKESLNLY